MKLLVINADDFGLDPAVNAAVARAHTEGILTSASLMVTAPHVTEAVEFARGHPRLGVGLHLCLVCGRAAAPAAKIIPLVDMHGDLPGNPFSLTAKLLARKSATTAIETEARAQINQFLATGLQPTHLDTHLHTHIHPVVLRIVARLAREFKIPYVRASVEPFWPSVRCDRQRLLRKLSRSIIFGTFGARSRRQLRRHGLHTADRAVGVLDPGHLTEEFIACYLRHMPDGLTEIFFHPAVETSASSRECQPGYQHAEELRALCSSKVRRLIEAQDARLTSFRELAERSYA